MLGRDVLVEPGADWREVWLLEVAFEQAPHSRLELSVVRLVVALPQAGENAENACVPLCRERPIGPFESFAMTGRTNVAADHRAFDRRRNIPARILQHRSEIVGRMPGECVLEVEQAEMSDAVAALDQHDVFGVIVAEDRDRAEAVAGDRLKRLAPRLPVGFHINFDPDRRAVPVGEQFQFLEPLIETVRSEAGHWRVFVQMYEHVRRKLVQLSLAARVRIERLAMGSLR